MTLNSKAIKISDRAFSVVKKELGERMNSNYQRLKFKDVASDLIINGFESKQNQSRKNEDILMYLVNLRHWENEFNRTTIEMVAQIIYWDHIKLALSKGFDSQSAFDHVNQFLLDPENQTNIIGVFENYLRTLTLNR